MIEGGFIGGKTLALLISGVLVISLVFGGILAFQSEEREVVSDEEKDSSSEGSGISGDSGDSGDSDGSEASEDSGRSGSLSDGPWPSFGRDSNNTGSSPYNTSHIDGTVNWTYETETWVWSSPAIGSEGKVYFGSPDSNFYALDADDGSEGWTFSTGGEIISSPAVSENERIYFGSSDNNLYALNPNGSLAWNYTTEGEIYSSPNLDEEGNIYVGSSDGSLYSLDHDGDLNWRTELDSWTWTSPALDDDVVYVGSGDGTLYAVDRNDGAELWSYSTGGTIYSSPTVGENGLIYFGSYDGNLYVLNPDGSLRWSYEIGSKIHPSPSLGEDGTVYVGSHDGEFHAVKNGMRKWSFETSERISSSAAIGSEGNIYFGSEDGVFYALGHDGSERWSYNAGGQNFGDVEVGNYESEGAFYSSPAVGEDGRVYVNSFDGNMYAFNGTGSEGWMEVEARFRIAGRKDNNITAVIEEDGEEIGNVELEREPGRPQEANITFRYREDSDYNLTVTYRSEHRGSNPVWMNISWDDENTTIFENFNHKDGEEQVVEYDLSEIIEGGPDKE
ncbi:MAG: PQQ-binding-like beta-propeller repeat protein [Candidatus Natronoplasma sp.]